MNTRFRKTRKQRSPKQPLRQSYGIVILPKGTRLYHASTNHLCGLPKKPFVFLTLHPSEWWMEDAFVSVIELQRDTTLLFMVKDIVRFRIFSALNLFLGPENTNLAKQSISRLEQWIPYLQRENLDGWFSSIENKTTIEFAILNEPSLLHMLECKPLIFNWTNTNYVNGELRPKQWGTQYPISSLTKPIHMKLHIRFKQMIESYQVYIEKEEPQGTAFSVLLENADILYFDGPVSSISWKSSRL